MEYKFIECGCGIGLPQTPAMDVSYEKEDIRKRLESLNVKKAFCFKNGDEDNDSLNKELAGNEFFIPAYTLNVEKNPEETEKLFKEYNAVRIHMTPAILGYKLKDASEHFEVLDNYFAVVTMSWNSGTKDEYEEILKNCRNLKLILTATSFMNITHIKELMKKYDNILIDTSYTSLYGIESVINNFGSERIIFTSCMPEGDAAGPIGRIIMAKISETDKENIAYKNISAITGVKL